MARDCTSRHTVNRGLMVLKIGGSIFSDKSRPGSLASDILSGYAQLIARDYRDFAGRLVLVTGGGESAHRAVAEAGDDRNRLLRLSDVVFELKSRWVRDLRAQGIDAAPLQLTSMVTLDSSSSVHVTSGVLQNALDLGVLPVLSGDVVFGNGGVHVIGSDHVPLIVAKALPELKPQRVVMLTDRPGVLTDGPNGSRVLEEINSERVETALTLTWSHNAEDVTGSMRGKLEALFEAAEQGVDCLITEGRPRYAKFQSLHDLFTDGFPAVGGTRIAARERGVRQ